MATSFETGSHAIELPANTLGKPMTVPEHSLHVRIIVVVVSRVQYGLSSDPEVFHLIQLTPRTLQLCLIISRSLYISPSLFVE